jgi:hypothetical protein
MKTHRGLITPATLAAAALAIAAPQAAANTLLSGYGGPGQGNQAILGAALINPPRGGGGSSAPHAEAAAPTGALASAGAGVTGAAPAASNRAAASGGGRAHSRAQRGNASAGGGRANGPVRGTPTPEAAVGSSTLGLSGADLLYILLVLGALAGTGVLTRRLASGPG